MTDVLPKPLVAEGVVDVDPRRRALTVRVSRDARGPAKVLWSEAIRSLAEAGPRYTSRAKDVWASGAGKDNIAYGVPVGGDGLEFKFDVGDEAYRQLMGTPGLRATLILDRATIRILAVHFRGR